MSKASNIKNGEMESAVRKRINDFLKMRHSNETAISNGDSALQRKLNRQLAHDSTLTVAAIEAVYKAFPDLNLEWLMTGVGIMTKAHQDESVYAGDKSFLNLGSQNLNLNIQNPEAETIIAAQRKEIDKLAQLLEEKEKTNRSLERTINILMNQK